MILTFKINNCKIKCLQLLKMSNIKNNINNLTETVEILSDQLESLSSNVTL